MSGKPYAKSNAPQAVSFPPSPSIGQRITGQDRNYEFTEQGWMEIPGEQATGTQPEYGEGLMIDETQTPPLVHLQPAKPDQIGGIFEPPADGQQYVRTFDASAGGSWVAAAVSASDSGGSTAFVGDEAPPHAVPGLLWWQPRQKKLHIYADDDVRWVSIG
jgi:hypothetical protein